MGNLNNLFDPKRIALIGQALGVPAVLAKHWAEGGAGAEALARVVADTCETHPGTHHYVYGNDLSLWQKIETIAQKIYGAAGIDADAKIKAQLDAWNNDYGHYPICIAKTQMSFSTDPNAKGAPGGHTVAIREVRLANGAGFIVAIAGDIMTMPGLPKTPAAEHIDIDENGRISGLF